MGDEEATMIEKHSSLMRPPEAAEYTGLAASTLAKCRVKGTGPMYIRLSARAVGYLKADLDSWLAAKRCQSTSEYPAK
jgi:predicted DNA-binding transcriptional regulator AlpA